MYDYNNELITNMHSMTLKSTYLLTESILPKNTSSNGRASKIVNDVTIRINVDNIAANFSTTKILWLFVTKTKKEKKEEEEFASI